MAAALVFFNRTKMPRHICHVDESGCLGALRAGSRVHVQPILAVVGVILPEESLARITPEFLKAKKMFDKNIFRGVADEAGAVRAEVKGKSLRGDLKRFSGGETPPPAALALNAALAALEKEGAWVVGRVCVKPAGKPFNGKAEYNRSVRFIAENFSRFLREKNARGEMVCDSRGDGPGSKANNDAARAARRPSGLPYKGLPKSPTFADSRDRVGLQLADWICSAVVSPAAAAAFGCGNARDSSKRVRENSARDSDQFGFGEWLRRRQLRFQSGGRVQWGLEIKDPRKRSAELLFRALGEAG